MDILLHKTNTPDSNKRYIASIADAQLFKRLYGLTELRKDWYNAFTKAIDHVIENIEIIDALLLPGDILDQEEVGSSALYYLTSNLLRLKEKKPDLPILFLLGNHDQPTESGVNWASFLNLINPNIKEPSFTNPLVVPHPKKDQGKKDLVFWGSHYKLRSQIIPEVEGLKPDLTKYGNASHWLVLHQALKELAPHPDAYDISVMNIPKFFDVTILGDFHDHDVYQGKNDDRLFIYTGSIETVSFNQTYTPGMLLINRDDPSDIVHLSTQQREYISLNLSSIPSEQWETLLTSLINNSMSKYSNKPILKIYYPADLYDEWCEVCSKIENLCLKVTSHDAATNTKEDQTELEDIDSIPTCKEDLIKIAEGEISKLAPEHSEDAIQLLRNKEFLSDIKNTKFPSACYKKEK